MTIFAPKISGSVLEVVYLNGLMHAETELRVYEEKKSFKVYQPDSATFLIFCMVQYNSQGRVIPHYYGENYRGFDIFETYRCFRGKLIPCWKGRNPYDDRDLCFENILKAPNNKTFKTRQEIVDWINTYTFLAQPNMHETDVLCSSTWEYEQDDTGYWSLSL